MAGSKTFSINARGYNIKGDYISLQTDPLKKAYKPSKTK